MKSVNRYVLSRIAQERTHAGPHLVRGFVGERHREDSLRRFATGVDEVGDAVHDDPRFPRPSPGEHEKRPVGRRHRFALLVVQVIEKGLGHRRSLAYAEDRVLR